MNDIVPSDLPLSKTAHVTRAAFFRLFLTEALPNTFTRVLYLDSDAVVVRSIKELFYLQLNAPVAAVDHYSPRDQYRLWGANGGSYFQSGVLLVDLDYWRRHDISKTFLKIMESNKCLIRWWDQDVLNIAFVSNWQRLDVWFNVSQCSLRYLPLDVVSNNARLIHYDGSSKPWLTDVPRPFRAEWHDGYLRMAGKKFDQKLIQRPFLRRMLSGLKQYTLKKLSE